MHVNPKLFMVVQNMPKSAFESPQREPVSYIELINSADLE